MTDQDSFAGLLSQWGIREWEKLTILTSSDYTKSTERNRTESKHCAVELNLKDGKRNSNSAEFLVPGVLTFVYLGRACTVGITHPHRMPARSPWLALSFWRGIWARQSFNNLPGVPHLVKSWWKLTLCGYQGNALQDSLVLLGQERRGQESTPSCGLELWWKRCTCGLSLPNSSGTSDTLWFTGSSDSSRNVSQCTGILHRHRQGKNFAHPAGLRDTMLCQLNHQTLTTQSKIPVMWLVLGKGIWLLLTW